MIDDIENKTITGNIDNKTDENPEVTKIKLGEKEYSQEELSQLVGLGEMAREAETKYDTKIDRVFPEYTKSTQEVKRLQRELDMMKNAPSTPSINGEDAEKAKQVLKQLGFLTPDEIKSMGFVSKDEARQEVINTLAARDLIDTTKDVIKDYVSKGLPKTTEQEILKYMDANDIKSPERAYKEMFEKEIDSWKESKYKETKRAGMYTETNNSTGRKEPPAVKAKNTDELLAQVTEFLNKGE